MKRLIAFCICLALLAGCGSRIAAVPAPQIIEGSKELELVSSQEDSSQVPDSSGSESGSSSLASSSGAPSSQSVASASSVSASQSTVISSSSQNPSSSKAPVSSSPSSSVPSSKPSSSSEPDYEIVDNENSGNSSGGSSSNRPSGGGSSGGSSSGGSSSDKPSSSSSSAAPSSSSSTPSSNSSGNENSSGETLSITVSGKKVSGDALDIVCQVVMNEIGDKWPEAAIQAQAVAVYTNVRRQNNSGTSPAFSVRTPSSALKKMVQPVLGEMVCYNGKPAMTTFFAISAGVTASSQYVWGSSYPYLTSVDSWDEAEYKDYEKTVTMSAASVMQKLESKLNVVMDANDKANWFEILDYHDGEYVKTIRIGGKNGVTTTGRNLRENILGLRSTAFDVYYEPDSDTFDFTTRGYGHGVGLSQVGAYQLALQGWDYVGILEHYYPGTEIGRS